MSAGDALASTCEEVATRLAGLATERVTASTPLQSVSEGRLAELADRFGLSAGAASLLGVAVTSSLDSRFGQLFASLDPGRARSRPRVDVAFALAGLSLFEPDDRALLHPTGVLRRAALITVDDEDGPLPDQVVGVPERIVAFLTGSDDVDPTLLPLLVPGVEIDVPEAVEIARALAAGEWLIWVRDNGGSARSTAVTALRALGAGSVVVDLDRLPPERGLADVLPAAIREAGLAGGGVVVGPVDLRRDRVALCNLAVQPIRPIVLVSPSSWDPALSAVTPVLLDAPRLGPLTRQPTWDRVVADLGIDEVDAVGIAAEMSHLAVAPDRAGGVGSTAAGLAVAEGEPLSLRHFRAAGLAQGAGRLDSLAQRVVPTATLDDLVLPADLVEELRSLTGRYRTRHIVRDQWGMNPRSRGRGITCLFAGASGTGKTLAAEVVAHELGVDLFIIDLSQIVDKYIGETEKNLERVFTEAEGVNGVLLFDEADALFGKRSEVRSAHDRHANVEVAYLLQRMERYEGVAVLTTNLRNNIDEAFSRRLDVVCSFPEPGVAERLTLWQRHLPPTVPLADDVDLAALAEHLPVSGGTIRNITLTAAHSAASAGTAIDQAGLVTAARREYTKLGRLFTAGALG